MDLHGGSLLRFDPAPIITITTTTIQAEVLMGEGITMDIGVGETMVEEGATEVITTTWVVVLGVVSVMALILASLE
jgi:hypothetical protein